MPDQKTLNAVCAWARQESEQGRLHIAFTPNPIQLATRLALAGLILAAKEQFRAALQETPEVRE